MKKKKLGMGNVFHNNTFALIFALVAAIVIWFAMSMSDLSDKLRVMYDVPIEIVLSDAAQDAGLKIFDCSYTTADVSVSGNSVITNKLTSADIKVLGTYSPPSTKTSGNNLKPVTIAIKATKQNNNRSDFSIVSVNPDEVNIVVDRLRETSFKIENDVKFTAGSGFYAEQAGLSETEVMVSGPESSVNKISRVAASYSIEEPLRQGRTFSCTLTLYDQDNKPMDYASMYITLSYETVEVNIPVMSKKTVRVVPTAVNYPEGFSVSTRITVEPQEIDIAGSPEQLERITELTLSAPIDFSQIKLKDTVHEMDILMPEGILNISNVTTAKVTLNFNGFKEVKITAANLDNIAPLNIPPDKNVLIHTKSLDISVIGSDAQVARLTGDSLYFQLDMTNHTENGGKEIPVTVTVLNANSCWVTEKYSVFVTVSDKVEETVTNADIVDMVEESTE